MLKDLSLSVDVLGVVIAISLYSVFYTSSVSAVVRVPLSSGGLTILKAEPNPFPRAARS
jgi:hypothetical protein